jgi:general secretion pathway protein H
MRRPRDPGFTLIEIMIVLMIVGAAIGATALSFRASDRTSAKSNAARLGSSIRYLYDRAVTTGGYYRLVINLSANKYWAERSDERFYLVRDKEESPGRGKAPDEAAKERKLKEEEEAKKLQVTGLAAQLQPPPEPRRARFAAFQDSTLPKVDLRGARLRDLYTRRQPEPYTEGKAYLYFFPDGHTERAVLHVEDTGGDVYTLFVHPLTGRVEVKSGDIPVARDFGDVDDEGQAEVPR